MNLIVKSNSKFGPKSTFRHYLDHTVHWVQFTLKKHVCNIIPHFLEAFKQVLNRMNTCQSFAHLRHYTVFLFRNKNYVKTVTYSTLIY